MPTTSRFFFLCLLLFFTIAPLIHASPLPRAGFLPSNIWFSPEPFFASDTVRIYTVLYNESDEDIEGTVTFLDNDTVLETADFSMAQGRVQDIWIDWTPAEGEHSISAKITHANISLAEGDIAITPAYESTDKTTIFVDIDTDKDGIGNRDDPDDDNDNIFDQEEIKNGTNPLIPNEPESTATATNDRSRTSIIGGNAAKDTLGTIAESAKKAGETALPVAENVLSSVYYGLGSFREKEYRRTEERIKDLKAQISSSTTTTNISLENEANTVIH